jgi:ubiquinone/menaquinone biosynthesis C-methylase UbiE
LFRAPDPTGEMRQSSISHYRSPATHDALALADAVVEKDEVVSGALAAPDGRRFPIRQGIPHLVYPDRLSEIEAQTQIEYDRVAERIYDAALDWQFAALYEDEERVREFMVDLLEAEPHHRILEVGAGTGRDSYRLARRLGSDGTLFLQDLSPNMVFTCRSKMAQYAQDMRFRCAIEYSVSNATYLPFPSDYFDAVFHFGGFNQFGDLKGAAAEFTRVTKPGGRVIYGDESVAPWLRGTEFERIVCTNNPLFRHDLPLATVPECARDVSVHWIMGNCFYLIAYRKGDGPPPLNLDLPHAGWRGGTMRTRAFGVLEGVTPEAKELARQAAARAGVSVHEWLDRLVRSRAEQDLGGTPVRPARGS